MLASGERMANRKAGDQMPQASGYELKELKQELAGDGVYISTRKIQRYTTEGRITTTLVPNPRGKGQIALYPPKTVEIIKRLELQLKLDQRTASAAEAEALLAMYEAQVAAFEKKLDQYVRSLPSEEKIRYVLDVTAEHEASGQVLPIRMHGYKWILFHMPEETLHEIMDVVFPQTARQPSAAQVAAASEWKDPVIESAFDALNIVEQIYRQLTRQEVKRVYKNLPFDLYRTWSLQASMARRFRREKWV